MKKLIALLFLPAILMGQDKKPYGNYIPSVAAKPKTGSMASVSNATVNLSTGTVQNKVAIYTIKENDFNWPISLGYSYSGLKTMDTPSLVGLGWGLSAIASVDREVRGIPDDYTNGYYGTQSIKSSIIDSFVAKDDSKVNIANLDQRKLIKEHLAYKLAQGIVDGEPDVFHVNLGHIQCSFKLGNNLTPVFLSEENIKVQFTWDEIKITDANGVIYTLKDKHIIRSTELSVPPNNGSFDGVTTYTSSWYLSKIEFPDTKNTIAFLYDVKTFNAHRFLPKIGLKAGGEPEFLIESQTDSISSQTGDTIPVINVDDYSLYTYKRKPAEEKLPMLTEISFTGGSLAFTSVVENDYPMYKSIQLKNQGGQVIDNYTFTQNSNKRRLLTSIKKNNERLYDFEYFAPGDLPAFLHNVKDKDVKTSFDFWGYYNGWNSVSALQRRDENLTKYPNFYTTKYGALTKITHKTGGTTSITYEPNTIKHKRHPILHAKPINRRVHLYSEGANSDNSNKEKTYTITFTEKKLVKIRTHARVYDHNTTTKISLYKQLSSGELDHQNLFTHDNVDGFADNSENSAIQDNYYGYFVGTTRPESPASSLSLVKQGYAALIGTSGSQQFLKSATPIIDVTIANTNNHGGNNTTAKSDSESPYFEINPGTYVLKVTTNKGGVASLILDYSNGQTPDYYNQPYGGLRVSSITNSSGGTAQSEVLKKYYYNDEAGYSTGQVIAGEENLFDMYYLSSRVYNVSENDLSFTINNQDYFSHPHVLKMHVKDRGLPVFYTKVSEAINPTIKTLNPNADLVYPVSEDDCHFGIVGGNNENGSAIHTAIGGSELANLYQPLQGYTTSEFGAPYRFKRFRAIGGFLDGDGHHEPPKGKDRSGAKLIKKTIYKSSEKFDYAAAYKLREQNFLYDKLMLPVNALEQSTNNDYPASLRVSSEEAKYMRNIYHAAYSSNALMLSIFRDKYKNASLKEYYDYAKANMSQIGSLVVRAETNSIKMINNVGQINAIESGTVATTGHEANRYVLTEYKEVDVKFRPKSSTSGNYFNESSARSLNASTNIVYDSKGKIKESTETDSQGNLQKVKYYYAYDISTAANQALVAANRIDQPIRTEVYVNNELQSVSEIEYAAFVINNTTYYLPKRLKSAKGNSTSYAITEFVNYDERGNLLELKQDNGLSTIFIWGYNNTKLLAKIDNASYSSMPADLISLINAVRTSSNADVNSATEQALRNELTKLRNHSYLASAQITSQTHDPFIGVTSATDVKGYTVYYTYDAQHRIKYLKDEEGNVLEAYNYNFKN